MEMNYEEIKEALIPIVKSMDWEKRDQFLTSLNDTMTRSEFAQIVGENLMELFHHGGTDFWNMAERCLREDVTVPEGYLISPHSIPEGNTPLTVLSFHGSDVHQYVDRQVTYYGNVHLIAKQGTARVMDSAYTIIANGNVSLEAYGETQVEANGQATVRLHDRARAWAYAQTTVYAGDRTFVQASGEAHLIVNGQAQFALDLGSPYVEAFESARGFVTPFVDPGTMLSLSDDVILYASCPESDLQITRNNFQGVALFDSCLSLGFIDFVNMFETEQCDLELGYESKGVEALRKEVLNFTPDDQEMADALLPAKSSAELLDLMAPHLDKLIDAGMTGAFLRLHFPENELEDHLIHAFSLPFSSRNNLDIEGTHRFFGTQLVYPDRCAGKVICYEKTLSVVREAGRESTLLKGEAQGLVMNEGSLSATNHSMVYGIDNGHISVYGNASAKLLGNAHADAKGRATVWAFNGSVNSSDNCRIYAYECSKASVSGKTLVYAYPGSEVSASDDVVVGLMEMQNKPLAKVNLSDNARSMSQSEFRAFCNHIDKQHTAGMRR